MLGKTEDSVLSRSERWTMPKLSPDRVPSYRLHKQSGQAIVTLSGRDVLLGAHGTRASREKYTRLLHEWEAAGRRVPVEPAAVTVSIVIAAYWDHCATYYAGPTGHGERRSIKSVSYTHLTLP